MDARGRIQRVNARDGNVYGDAKIIIWGTCNDDDELKNAHKGAIWSRFSQKLECKRPDRALMNRILNREVEEIGGNPLWVDPILKFCFDELAGLAKFKMDYNDPRFVRSLLAGGDRILDTSPMGALADFRKANGI